MSREVAAVHVQGRALRCLICSHDAFWEREVDLSAPGLGLFSLDDGSRAHCAVCARCGHVHMFIAPSTVSLEADVPAGGPLPEAAA